MAGFGPSRLESIAALLSGARRISIMTGAGMSAESGIQTFRGARSGLWARFDPQALATEEAFRRDPALVWGWYWWRTELVEQASPHAGHFAIAELAQLKPGAIVITQNVDDLHERAGNSEVVHLHGSLFAPRCLDCGKAHLREGSARPGRRESDAWDDSAGSAGGSSKPAMRLPPPACSHCGGPIRPGVVWFGESLPASSWERATRALESCDALLVVGTSGVVQPAASLPGLVKSRGKPVLEINPAASEITRIADIHWDTTAAAGLPPLIALLRSTAA